MFRVLIRMTGMFAKSKITFLGNERSQPTMGRNCHFFKMGPSHLKELEMLIEKTTKAPSALM
jgi:hypothetical protein